MQNANRQYKNIEMEGNNFWNEDFDDIDVAISQMASKDFEYIDLQGNFAYEILDDIDEAMSQIGEFDEFADENGISVAVMDCNNSVEASEDLINDEMNGKIEENSSNDGDGSDIPPEIIQQYEQAMGRSMPKKSVLRYELMYKIFMQWQTESKTKSFDEKVLIAYFSSIAEKYAPTTLWSRYSMLKKTLICKENVDISSYKQLSSWLKQNGEGYEPKQSNVFEPEDITKFVVEAPNEKYLAMKAILGIGILSVCRGEELTKLTVNDLKDTGNEFILSIPKTRIKTKVNKTHVIEGEFTNIIRRYIALRPPHVPTDRLFLQYRNGKCTCQVIGKNTIAQIPKEMAKFLKLPNPDSYTGHSYRRTGTTIAANNGANLEQLKRIGDWKSAAVCERYIHESLGHKRKLGRFISGGIHLPSSSSTTTTSFGNINMPDTANTAAMPETSAAVVSPSIIPAPSVSTGMIHMPQYVDVRAGTTSSTIEKFGNKLPDDEKKILFHFGGECSSFTINYINHVHTKK